LNFVRTRFVVIGLAALGLAAFASACGDDAEPSYNKLFQAPPWNGPETLTYDLVDQGNKPIGICILETKPDAAAGQNHLITACSNGPYHDDGSVTVDALTLRPLQSERVIADESKNKRTTLGATYSEKTVKLTREDGGKTNATFRDLPQANSTSAEPGYYDDQSLLWMLRGLRLEKGFKGAYRNITSSTVSVVTAKVSVAGSERVRVAAGEFTAWNVRVETDAIVQHVWVDIEAPHRVVKARLEDTTFELAKIQ
jgi:hypothetical protein